MRINYIGVPYCGSGISNHTWGFFNALNALVECVYYSIDIRDSLNYTSLRGSKDIIFIFWNPDVSYRTIRENNPEAFIIAYPIFEWTKFEINWKAFLDTHPDKIAFPSTWARQIALENGISEDKTFIIPGGVDSKYLQDSYLMDKPIKFLFVGKDEKRKSIEKLLSEWINFNKVYSTVKLHVLLTDQFTKGFNATKRIQFYTDVNDLNSIGIQVIDPPKDVRDMRRLYDLTQYILCPSKAGGIELPIIEGMSRGCIPIATDYSGMGCYIPDFAKQWSIPVKEMSPMYDNRWFLPQYNWGVWAFPDWDVFQERLITAFLQPFDETLSVRLRMHAQIECNFDTIAKLVVKYLTLLEARRDH
jgi:glycosyltransferase involved in cell wall biosynthesis